MLLDRLVKKRVDIVEKEIMQKYFAEVESMYTKMRGWRHDYRHHIQTLKVYAAGGDVGEIRDYLDMLDQDLTSVETVVRTGNRIADAILNSKLSLAVEREIQVKAEARIPVSLTTSAVDLCIILGNLLDNAIDACMELPPKERLIRLFMEMKGNYLYLVLTNTAGGGKKKHFGSSRGEGHGFGLGRLDEAVRRNGGYVIRASEDNAFSTEILLPQ